MRFKKYLTEATVTGKVRKEIQNWLKLNPDYIIYNAKIIKKTNDIDFLINLLQKPQDTVTISKDTIEGTIGIQLYLDKGKVKIDKIEP